MKKFQSWRQLQTFICVAEYGSYRAAATAMGITSSTVARHIEGLSQEVGQPVVLPRDNRWVPTEVGKQLLTIAEQAQINLGIVLHNLENTSDFRGSVKLSTLSFVSNEYLAAGMGAWRRDNPNAPLKIDETDDTRAVERGEADVALRLTRPDTPGIARFKVANCYFGVYTPTGGNPDAWVGYTTASDSLPEVQLANSHFKGDQVLGLGSLRAIIHASLATGLSCVVPTCLARAHPQLEPVSDAKGPLIAKRELWFVFYETRKNDLAINAARQWVKTVFPSNKACLCGQCPAPAAP